MPKSRPPRPVDAIVRHLRTTEVLRLLPETVLAGLARRCRTISAVKGQVLFTPGGPAAAYALIRGRVSILVRPEPDVELELLTRSPGQICGAVSLFAGRQINEGRAATGVSAVRIEANVLRTILAGNAAAMEAFAALLAKRAEVTEARLSEAAIHNVPRRLMLLLQRLAASGGVRDSRGTLLPDHLTHDELARLLGVSRESVSRALGKLRRDGKVSVSGRRLILPRARMSGGRLKW